MFRRMVWVLLGGFVMLAAQQEASLTGYVMDEDRVTFVFDEQVYGIAPQRVVVTGAFRGWSQDMEDEAWQLKKQMDGLWMLTIDNRDFETVAVKSPFKFRVNDGRWLDPPADAPNVEGGNLLFAHTLRRMRVIAEVAGERDIRLKFPEAKPDRYIYDTSNYILKTYGGDSVAIERLFYTEPGELQIVPAVPVNPRRLHYLTVIDLEKTVPVFYDGWFRHTYSGKKLGANFNSENSHTMVRLFAARADLIKLYLYKEPGERAAKVIDMKRDADGVWEARLPGNWEGWYYDFTAHGPDEPGNHFYETNPVHFTDPWARVSLDSFGPARIWPEMKPATPLENGIPKPEDIIAYEVHVQDFTRNLPIADSLKGTFKGFIEPGLTNSAGEPIGFDHLLDLGINVVHLMPVQEYLHYPNDEWQAAFKNDPYMIEQGINMENYQWGYRTSHAFALESRFRVKGQPHGSQNEDFRDLVQAFHDKGIAVIVDVVFNHTAERMDARMMYFNFSAIDVPYFYRTDDELDYLGEYGTETKSEERPMMQRWIIEQVTDMVHQYGIDGVRIDLAGQTDEQTLLALREALGPDKIVYGEPWIASADPDYENNPDWDWYKADSPIIFFQDDARNAFKGPTSVPQNKSTDRGYAGGDGNRDDVKLALSAGFPDDDTPVSGINYLDIHDNWALADRFATTDWDGRQGVDEAAYKIAATMLFTSPGPIVLHGGSEFMRSKGVAPLVQLIKYTKTGPIYIHGKRDTYNLARANEFVWENLGRNIGDGEGINCNYANMNAFWKGLIELRLSEYGKVLRIAEKPADDYYTWIEPANPLLLGYIINNNIFVLLNTDKTEGAFDVNLPEGTWKLVANNDRVDVQGIEGVQWSALLARSHSFTLPGESVRVWVRE